MTNLHEAFRARLAGLLVDGRAIPDAEAAKLADAVEANAGAIVDAAADSLTSVVAAIVPAALRPAVLNRLVERIDLVPWPIGAATKAAADLWTLTGAMELARDAAEGMLNRDTEDMSPEDAAAIAEAMRLRPVDLYRWFSRLHVVDDDGSTQRIADHPVNVLFGESIRALVPPKKRAEVEAIVRRAWWFASSVDDSTPRLVAWFFVDETSPDRLARIAAEDVLSGARAKGDDIAKHPEALRELSRRVEDWLPLAPKPVPDVDVVEGVHPLDEALAALLERIGETGRKRASDVRENRNKRTPEQRADRWRTLVEPLRVPGLLAQCLWADVVSVGLRGAIDDEVRREERLAKVPAPTIHPAPRNAILLAPLGLRANPDGSLATDDVGRRGYLPPVALVSVGERALSSSAGKIVPTLAALLSREAWDRWQRGIPRFDWIAVPAGRNALHALGIDATEDELDEAIAWLMELKVGGLPCVDASPPPQEVIGDEKRTGGRPEKKRIIRVGAPLAPMGLESVYRDAGMVLPPELRFFSPVLNPAEAPLIGHRQTYARQRDFFALGIGSFFVEHREQYAERGGVKIDVADWRRFLSARGIYHRSHQSLADQMWDAYRSHRKPGLPGIGPRAAVLVETAPGSGVWKLGPDFADQERVILNAAERTAKRRRDAHKRRAAKRRSQTDS